MIMKLVRKYWYGKKVPSAMLSPGGIKTLAHYDSPYEWNNHGSTWKKGERMNIRRVKPFIEDLDNE